MAYDGDFAKRHLINPVLLRMLGLRRMLGEVHGSRTEGQIRVRAGSVRW